MAKNTIVQYILKVDAKGAQRSLDQTGKEAEEAAKSFDKLGNESKGLNRDLKNTETQSKLASKEMKNLGIGIAAMTAAMAAAITGVVELSQKFADLTNELVDASTKTGIAVDTLAGLRLAAEGSGRSFSSLEGGLIRFQSSMDSANKGTKLAADAFKDLGVDVANADGSLRDADTVFNETISALSELENQTERNATAMLLFGRSGGPALIQSGALDNLENMTDLAKEFGVSINKDAIGSMGQFQRSMAEFETVGMGALQNIINSIAGPNSVTMALQGASQAAVYMGSIFSTVFRAVSASIGNVVGLIFAATMAMEGNVEGAKVVIGDLKRESNSAFGDLKNVFKNASDELDRFNELSERSTAPKIMKNTGDNTGRAADEMERLTKATEEALKAQEELHNSNDEMMDKTSDLAAQVNDRLKSAYDKQIESIKELGGEISNQIAELDYELGVLLDQAEARKLNASEQERLLSIAEEIGLLEEIAADNRIAEQKELIALQEEKRAKQEAAAAKESERIKKESERIRKEGEKRTREAQRLKSETDIIVKSINALANLTSDLFIRPTGQLDAMLQKVERIKNKFDQIKETGFKGFAEEGISNTFKKLGDAEGLQQGLQGGIQKLDAVASLDAASIVSLVSPIAGAFTSIVQGLGERVLDQGPEEIRRQALAQAEAIKAGIAFLPELLLSIAPQLGLAIAEAFVDGIQLLFRNLIQVIKDIFSSPFSLRDRDPDGNSGSQRFRESLARFFDPDQSASFMSGGRFIPKAKGGIRFTGMQDGLAMLHRGEFVVPQSGQRPQQVDRQLNGATGGGMTVNINSAVVDRNAVDALVRQIEIRFNNQFGTSSSNLFGGR